MKVKGNLEIECSECGRIYSFEPDEADFDTQTSEEGPMGLKIERAWNHSINCEECENEIRIEYMIEEYPSGALNQEDLEVIGADEIERFTFSF